MSAIDRKITLETDCVSIVANLIWWGNDEKLIWTERIISRITSKPLERVQNALCWLRERSYITTHKGEYLVTEDGRGFYDAAKRNPDGMVNIADLYKWKQEVLTGMVEQRSRKSKFTVTEKSEIDRAALPTTQPEIERGASPEDIMSDYESRRRQLNSIARSLKLTPEQLVAEWNEDRVRVCTTGGQHHFGVFDKGETVCRKCKQKRGKK